MPSNRWEISLTAVALSSVIVNSGRTSRARSVNNSIASSVSDSDGTRRLISPTTPIGSTARGEKRQPRTAAQQTVDERSAGIEQMLAVVQHDQI